jgi:hypothetical protein
VNTLPLTKHLPLHDVHHPSAAAREKRSVIKSRVINL